MYLLLSPLCFTTLFLSCIGEGSGTPLQCSCLENPRLGGAWWAAVYGVAQSWTWLKWLSSSSILPKSLGTILVNTQASSGNWETMKETIIHLDKLKITSLGPLLPLWCKIFVQLQSWTNITQISRYIGQWISPWITQNWICSIPCLLCTYTVKGLVGHVSWHLNLFLPYGAAVKKATLIYLNRFVSLSLLGKRVRRKLLLLSKNIPLH